MAEQPPVVDISALRTSGAERKPTALASVARELAGPCREWGVFLAVGHGIPRGELADFDAAMHAFFALPRQAKLALRRTRDNAMGYYDEELTKNRPDWKEVFDYRRDEPAGEARHSDGVNQWPDALPQLEAILLRHHAACDALARRILPALCVSLGLAADTLDAAFRQDSSFVRLNRYAACADAAPPDAPLFPETGRLGVHHHTDAGALTLLYQDDVAGLQVLHRDRFVLVEPVDGALAIHLGDMLQVWSNDRYLSPVHRVIASPERDRYSAPYFFNPSYETVCEPLPELVGPRSPAQYRPIAWSHFRDQRSAGDYANYGSEIQIADFRLDDLRR